MIVDGAWAGATPHAAACGRARSEGQGGAAAAEAELHPLERQLLEWTNALRRRHGLAPLALHGGLLRAARLKCEEMSRTGQVTHRGSDGSGPLQLQRRCGVRLRVMGAENLAWQRDLAWAFHALAQSEPHRENMLLPAHTLIGVAARRTSPCGVLVCQQFGGS